MVRRVAKDLLANDETEVSEVVRRRLFDDVGQDRFRKKVSRVYADWCFASVVLGQLGESRLSTAIDADIAGTQAHARALDADT